MKSAKLQKEVTSFGMLFLMWRDKWDVLMLSTFHDNTFIEKRRRNRQAEDGVETINKPNMIEEYNLHMGGVDKGECHYTSIHM